MARQISKRYRAVWGVLLLVTTLCGWWWHQVPATMRYLGQFPCAARAFLIPCPTGFLTGDPNGIITLRTWRTGAPPRTGVAAPSDETM